MRGTSSPSRGVRHAVALVLAAVVVATGFSLSSHVTTVAAATSSSKGCGAAVVSGSHSLSKKIAGHKRVFVVHVPSHYSSTKAVALVLNMHGSGSTALAQESFSGMDATSDEHTFIVAYPQGLIASGTGFDWNVPNVPLLGGAYPPADSANDVTFLVDLVSVLESSYCINPHEIYATGMSGGGRMASQLACDGSGVFAAVAPVAGLRFPSPCPTTRAVPVVAFHGTADPIDPYKGHGQAYWTYSVKVAASLWGGQDACASSATVAQHSGYTLTTYARCKSGADVELYSLKGEGHEWPGGPTVSPLITDVLGPQSNAVDADEVMWSFFMKHPLASAS
jgi:polyhydroxybutyrate depolymerase